MTRVVCFGEIMGRLCPPGFKKVVQANNFELTFAGGEANVAVSLSNYGINTSFVTKIPDNDIGKSVIRVLRSYGVNTQNIVIGGERLGMYYVEKGASQRPSKVTYDRKYSSISAAQSTEFDWNKILDGAEWFHFTGITPALSDSCIEITREALKVCKAMGIKVSCDLNYRKTLWSNEKAKEVMTSLMQYVDVCIANEEDAESVFDISAQDTDIIGGKINKDNYTAVAKEIEKKFGCKTIATTLRESYSASVNGWSAMLYTGGKTYFSEKYDIQLIDRVGGGDSFVGGLLYGLLAMENPQEIIEFAVAASCLKHTIEGDFNQVNIKDVETLMNGDGSGRVQR